MKRKLLIITALVSGFIGLQALRPARASAVTAADWRAGRIIDDNVFTNKDAMSVQEIQNFLNSKVGTGGYNSVPGQCDVNGTRNAAPYNSSITRAAYARSIGKPDKWTCLSNYYEVPKTTPGPGIPANNYGNPSAIPAGAKSAAQLIYDAAQAYGISPKVLLVTIHKESAGPLTTDDWPWQSQFTYAMGAHCPDSGPNGSANCDPNYAGFSMQIRESAALMRWYLDNMNQPWWSYKKPGNNSVRYDVEVSCGSSNVFIESKATAALYTYTPYQPNQAALNNMYGTGDSCSAYGNRNFWRIYHDWFGPTTSLLGGVTMTTIDQPDLSPAIGQTVSYTYTLTNNLSVPVTLDAVGIVGRSGSINGPNRDFGWQGPVTINSGATQQFTFTYPLKETGPLYAWPAVLYQGSYVHYNNWGALLNVRTPSMTITSPLTPSLPNPVATQTGNYSVTVRNEEDQAIAIDSIGIPVRYYNTYNYDAAWASSDVMEPGESKIVTGNVIYDKAGPYSAWVSGLVAGRYFTLAPTITQTAVPATPNFQLSYIEGPNPNPAIGEDIAVQFKLKNNSGIDMTLGAVGVVGRYDNPYSGPNRDFGWVGPISFTAGEEKSFTTFVSNVSQLQNFYAWVAVVHQGRYIHYNNWGFMMTPHIPNLTTSTPLTINNGSNPVLGQTHPVTVTIKNNEPKPIKYSAIGIPARYYGVYNYDVTWQGAGTLAASGQSGDSITLNGNILFDKSGPYTIWPSINIQGRYQTIGNPRNISL